MKKKLHVSLFVMFENKKAICHKIIPYYQNLEVFQEFELLLVQISFLLTVSHNS